MFEEDENTIKPEFLDDSDIFENDYLWKFVSIEKFFSFVLNKKIYLTRLDKFEDALEGISLDYVLFNKTKDLVKKTFSKHLPPFIGIEFNASESDKFYEEFQKFQQSYFASCWFISQDNVESAAMWNLYSAPNSFAIKINYNKFKSNFTQFRFDPEIVTQILLGRVNYYNFQNPSELIEKKKSIKSPVFLKDISYIHEKEFRIVAKIEPIIYPEKKYKTGISKETTDNSYKKQGCIGINLELLNFESFDFEYIFHPKTESWIKADLKMILNKFGIPFKNILESNLKFK